MEHGEAEMALQSPACIAARARGLIFPQKTISTAGRPQEHSRHFPVGAEGCLLLALPAPGG